MESRGLRISFVLTRPSSNRVRPSKFSTPPRPRGYSDFLVKFSNRKHCVIAYRQTLTG